MRGHDIVVIGASAGGVQALTDVLRRLPGNLPAAVFVVLHMAAKAPSALSAILSRCTSLPVAEAQDGEPIRPGRIYVSRPDYHLLIQDGRVRLGHGPKEQHTRPAVDPLFRTAAETYGPRVVGVVLTGAQCNGSQGLLAVKQHGGVAMVQDPAEALWPSMPASAIRTVGVDHVLPLSDLAGKMTELVLDPPGRDAAGATVAHARPEQAKETRPMPPADLPPEVSPLTCPECGSVLFQQDPPGLALFSCRVGHTFSGPELLAEQTERLEAVLWSAVRIAEEQACLARQLAQLCLLPDEQAAAAALEGTASAAERNAAAFRRLIETGEPASETVDTTQVTAGILS